MGEAPGSAEAVVGLPFVGPSGQMLDRVFKKAGLGSTKIAFVTNALRCKPPYGTPPSTALLEACRGRLLAELEEHPRKMILTLGNSALRAVTGNHKLRITQARGKPLELALGVVLPTLHPAAVMRNPSQYKQMEDDILYALALFQGAEKKSPGEETFLVCDSLKLARRAISALLKSPGPFAVDIETTGLSPRRARILAVGVAFETNKTCIFPDPFWRELEGFFRNTDPARIVWHNGKFDTAFLRAAKLPAEVREDTLLLHYALAEEGGHGLKQLSEDFLGAGDYKAVLKPYLKSFTESFETLPPELLYEYLAKDCDYTLQLYTKLRPRVTALATLRNLYEKILIPASSFIQRLEQTGMPVDLDRLNKVEELLTTEKAELEVALDESLAALWNVDDYVRESGAKAKPSQFNPLSAQQIMWLLFDRLQLPVPRTGRTSNEEFLADWTHIPWVGQLLRFRKLSKELKTYVEGIRRKIDDDGRVRSTYLLHATVSGRLSSREPNLQNIPRTGPIKSIFTPRQGRVLLEADYSQAELRVMASLSKDEWLTQVYAEGRDLHSEVAASLFGPDYTPQERQKAKTYNFGILYGRGKEAVAEEFGISSSQAQDDIDAWRERMPGASLFLDRCREAAVTRQALVSVFGRIRRPVLLTQENAVELQNQFMNFPIQSTASDLTLLAAMQADPELRAAGAKIINLVHDSILVECPRNAKTVRKLIEIIRQAMLDVPCRYLGPAVPFAVDFKLGASWGSMKELRLVS